MSSLETNVQQNTPKLTAAIEAVLTSAKSDPDTKYEAVAGEHAEKLALALKELVAEAQATVVYLDSNRLNSIPANSKGHLQLREAIARAERVFE